jgi:hypothetical protein
MEDNLGNCEVRIWDTYSDHRCPHKATGIIDGKHMCKMHINKENRRMGIVENAVSKYYPHDGTIFLITGTVGKVHFSKVTFTDVFGKNKYFYETNIPLGRLFDNIKDAANALIATEDQTLYNLKQKIYDTEQVIDKCKEILFPSTSENAEG